MDKLTLEAKVRALDPWFHYIKFPYGIESRPCTDLSNDVKNHPLSLLIKLVKYLPTTVEDLTVFDMGCNGGAVTLALARQGAQVTSADLNPRYVAQTQLLMDVYAQECKYPAKVSLLNVENITVQEQYDLVLGLGLFYHVENPLRGIANLVHSTKIGGSLLIESNCTTQIPEGTLEYLGHAKPYKAVWRFTPKALLDMFEECGCRIDAYELLSSNSRILFKATRVK